MQIIEKIEFNLKEIKADNGKYITLYKDSDDIKDYYSTTVMYCPLNFDISQIKEVDLATNENYIKNRDAAILAEIEKKETEEEKEEV